MEAPILRDIWGRERVSPLAAEGIFSCPFCSAASRLTDRSDVEGVRCANPWCEAYWSDTDRQSIDARPRYLDAIHETALRDEESRRRARDAEWAIRRAQESREIEIRVREERGSAARAAGKCVSCATVYPYKLIRHRGECPRNRRRR